MTKATRLIHIAPELSPTVGGVADYTALLSRRLVEGSDGAMKPVLVHAGNQTADTIETHFPTLNLSGECSASVLAEEIMEIDGKGESTVVVLQYSGYGYAERGMPWWLVRALRRSCSERGIPLVTMFHELYASAPFWSKQYWLSFAQAHVLRRLARMSTGVVTNRPDSADWLRGVSETPVQCVPVFSNVGEPESSALPTERGNYAVVFGSTGKDALYGNHGHRLGRVLQGVDGIDRIVDLGPPSTHAPQDVGGVRLEEQGIIGRAAVSDVLRTAALGVLCRNPVALTKSGALAAYLAHGVPAAVALRGQSSPNPMLREGTHYLSLDTALTEGRSWTRGDWKKLGRRGREWYVENAHSQHTAEVFIDLLRSVSVNAQ